VSPSLPLDCWDEAISRPTIVKSQVSASGTPQQRTMSYAVRKQHVTDMIFRESKSALYCESKQYEGEPMPYLNP
jgi:hypothetical protein